MLNCIDEFSQVNAFDKHSPKGMPSAKIQHSKFNILPGGTCSIFCGSIGLWLVKRILVISILLLIGAGVFYIVLGIFWDGGNFLIRKFA